MATTDVPLPQAKAGADGRRRRMCDCVGVVCSCACAVHCAAMPFVIGWLPALGLTWLADEGFHQWMVAICFLLAVTAVLPGYRRHRRLLVPLLAVGGVSVLSVGAFALPDECCRQCASDVTASSAPSDGESEVTGRGASKTSDGVYQQVSDIDWKHGADSTLRSCCLNGECGPSEEALTAPDAAGVFAGSIGSSGGWLGWLSRLLTPFGGTLLVAAHLLNRHCCACGSRDGTC